MCEREKESEKNKQLALSGSVSPPSSRFMIIHSHSLLPVLNLRRTVTIYTDKAGRLVSGMGSEHAIPLRSQIRDPQGCAPAKEGEEEEEERDDEVCE